MAIQVSPSVVVKEVDLTNVISTVQSSVGAAIIDAAWGPVMAVTSVDSENVLVQRFGKPNSTNAANWMSAANFLAYSSALQVVRTDTTDQVNAVATATGRVTAIAVGAGGTGYDSSSTSVAIAAPNIAGGVQATAVATITGGVITSIQVTEQGSGYTSAPAVTITGAGSAAAATATIVTGGVKINNRDSYDTFYSYGAGVVGAFAARYPGSLGNSLKVSLADAASFDTWAYKSLFGVAPGTSESASNAGATGDEIHVVVVDRDGRWSGAAGTVLESFSFLSKASNAKKTDGSSSYYKNALNNFSNYIYWMDHPTVGTNWGNELASGTTFTSIGASALVFDLTGGADDFTSTDAQKMNAFALFQNDELFDINLVIAGRANRDVASFIISNVAEYRKDCIVCISPQDVLTGEPIVGNISESVNKIIKYKNGDGGSLPSLPSTSYAVYDTGYKYQYDRYNDVYRWVPLCGDIAGLCARTDYTNDPWFSPAGFNRGQIKNVIKLAFNPSKTDRDTLYVAGINPVVSFPGQGVVLYGDKTAQAKPSAFDRINVRRLFITLEKTIATAAKYQLFEFNDAFTRAQFRNIVEPYLRDVQGRRGITDFKVICDESNNTSEVIDSNRFVASIYIKPNRSINFIELSFVATRTGASFSEIAGS
jgi:hypothetical protein